MEVLTIRGVESDADAVHRAAAALAAGRLVVLPTETTYGIAAAASDRRALDALWRAKGGARRTPIAWHVSSAEALRAALSAAGMRLDAVHRRVIERLVPGPITLAVPLEPPHLAALWAHSGVGPGVIDDGVEALLRVPDRAVTRRIIERAAFPIVIAAPGSSGAARDARSAAAAIDTDSIALLLDDGPTEYSKRSSLVRLDTDGGITVAREGALDEPTIRKRLARTLLFVCTGNTCRSPMAAAIARHLIATAPPEGFPTRVRSAGVAAGFGMAATPEGVEALQALGIEAGSHSSTPLSRELLYEAEAVYVMTRSHLEAARRLDPTLAGRVMLLDPEGRDIPDPIGGPRAAYDETAQVLLQAVRLRIEALRSNPEARPPQRVSSREGS